MLATQTALVPTNGTQTQLMVFSEGAIDHNGMDAQVRVVERKEHVFLEGDDATHIFKVEAGHVCIYRLLADGRRQIVDFAFAGDFIGLGANGQHTTNAQASERTRLRSIRASELRNVVRENPRLGLELYEAMSNELSAARELLVSVCQRTAQERVAGFLLAIAQRNARRGEDASCVVLPMTRTDIADYLGLTIETVSRTFTKLRKDGLIDIEQCIIITINDSDALADIADGGCD
jgi:CRP/FNR family transcriptional regulator